MYANIIYYDFHMFVYIIEHKTEKNKNKFKSPPSELLTQGLNKAIKIIYKTLKSELFKYPNFC